MEDKLIKNSSQKQTSLKRGIFLIFILVLLVLLFLELSLRTYDILTGQILSSDLLANLYLMTGEDHPVLGYTSKKNFHGFLPHLEPGKKFETHTNAHGFRTKEFYPKLPNTYRIVLMGDSFIYGYNANQNETVAVVLEKLLNEQNQQSQKNIEVLSLAVASYSTLEYAALTKLYLDYLKPDMIIVSIDQSDLKSDLGKVDKYIFDQDGAPLIRKDFIQTEQNDENIQIVSDQQGGFNIKPSDFGWLLRLRFGSSLFNHTYILIKSLQSKAAEWKINLKIKQQKNELPIIKYEDLVKQYGSDLSQILPETLLVDAIPYDLKTALEKYQPTFQALKYIKDTCDKNKVKLYFASYPYPWMVSAEESLHHQMLRYGAIYDFRANRVHPELMQKFSDKLDVKHLNAYPVFEQKTPEKKYGNYDQHFSAFGYYLYAEFLAEVIKGDIQSE